MFIRPQDIHFITAYSPRDVSDYAVLCLICVGGDVISYMVFVQMYQS